MNEEALKYLYDLFTKDGYKGSIDDYKSLINSNKEALDYSYQLFNKDGYTGNIDDFSELIGITTQPVEQEMAVEAAPAPTQERQSFRPTYTPATLSSIQQDTGLGFEESDPTEPSKWEQSKNMIYNTWQGIKKAVIDTGVGLQKPKYKLEQYINEGVKTIQDKLNIADETADMIKDILNLSGGSVQIDGKPQSVAETLAGPIGVSAELGSRTRYVKPALEAMKEGDAMGVAIGAVNGALGYVPSILIGAVTGGLGFVPMFAGSGFADAAALKAELNDTDIKEILESGEADVFVPALIGGLAGFLEKFGLAKLKKLFTSKLLTEKGIDAVKSVLFESGRQGFINYIEGGMMHYNLEYAKSGSLVDAGEEMINWMLSEEGANAAIEAALGTIVTGGVGAGYQRMRQPTQMQETEEVPQSVSGIEQKELNGQPFIGKEGNFVYQGEQLDQSKAESLAKDLKAKYPNMDFAVKDNTDANDPLAEANFTIVASPAQKESYSLAGEQITREQAQEAIQNAESIADLEGLNIQNDQSLMEELQLKAEEIEASKLVPKEVQEKVISERVQEEVTTEETTPEAPTISQQAGNEVTVRVAGENVSGTIQVDEGGKVTLETPQGRIYDLEPDTPFTEFVRPVSVSEQGDIEVNGESFTEARIVIEDGQPKALLIKEDGTTKAITNPRVVEEIEYQIALANMEAMSDQDADNLIQKYEQQAETETVAEEGVVEADERTADDRQLQEAIEEIELIEQLALEELEQAETSAKLVEITPKGSKQPKVYLVKKNEDGTYDATLNGRRVKRQEVIDQLGQAYETETRNLVGKLQDQVNKLKQEVEQRIFGKDAEQEEKPVLERVRDDRDQAEARQESTELRTEETVKEEVKPIQDDKKRTAEKSKSDSKLDKTKAKEGSVRKIRELYDKKKPFFKDIKEKFGYPSRATVATVAKDYDNAMAKKKKDRTQREQEFLDFVDKKIATKYIPPANKGKTPLDKRKLKGENAYAASLQPQSVEDLIYQWFLNGGRITSDAIDELFSFTGQGGKKKNVSGEKNARISYIRTKEKGGKTIDEAVQLIYDNLSEQFEDVTDDVIRSAFQDIVKDNNSLSRMAKNLLAERKEKFIKKGLTPMEIRDNVDAEDALREIFTEEELKEATPSDKADALNNYYGELRREYEAWMFDEELLDKYTDGGRLTPLPLRYEVPFQEALEELFTEEELKALTPSEIVSALNKYYDKELSYEYNEAVIEEFLKENLDHKIEDYEWANEMWESMSQEERDLMEEGKLKVDELFAEEESTPTQEQVLTPSEFSKNIESEYGVELDLLGDLEKGYVTLSKLVIPKDKRDSGIGTEIMEKITAYADKNNLTLDLTPSKEFGATSVGRLSDFYKRFGFVENKGKNKDFLTKESMVRKPKVDENKIIADRIRNKKIDGALSSIDFGLTPTIYNGAIDYMANQVEKGTKLGKAIANTIKWIDSQMKGKKWNKGAFGSYMNDTYKVTLPNGQEVDVQRDDSKKTAEVINGWYQPIEQVILDTKQDKLPAKEWANRLRSKEDEDVWTGVRGFLESKGNESVSKKELLDFMKENRVEIVEVVKGELSEDEIKQRDSIQEQINDIGRQIVLARLNNESEKLKGLKQKEDALFQQLKPLDDKTNQNLTKFSQYQLEGEKSNYKEVLVTLPSRVKEVHTIKESNGKYYVISPSDEAVTSGISDRKVAEERAKILDEKLAKNPLFKSSHFDEPNILAHLRMNTRTASDGSKVLFLEEIQSDWGQEGKKKGFKRDVPKGIVNVTYKDLEIRKTGLDKYALYYKGTDVIIDGSYSNERTAQAILQSWKDNNENFDIDIEKEQRGIDKSVLAAPFVTDTNSWVKLGIKTAIKEAVAQGTDKIAWTTGEQQNERYDLSTKVDKLTWDYDKSLGEGNVGTITGYFKGEEVLGDTIPVSKLPDIIGKELAEKILQQEETISDFNKYYHQKKLNVEEIKVGGKGMKGFYDNIVPSVAKAVVKELTGKEGVVGETILNAGEKAESGFDSEGNIETYRGESTQQSIDITPELKASVNIGMPLFGKAETRKELLKQELKDALKEVKETFTKGGFDQMGIQFDFKKAMEADKPFYDAIVKLVKSYVRLKGLQAAEIYSNIERVINKKLNPDDRKYLKGIIDEARKEIPKVNVMTETKGLTKDQQVKQGLEEILSARFKDFKAKLDEQKAKSKAEKDRVNTLRNNFAQFIKDNRADINQLGAKLNTAILNKVNNIKTELMLDRAIEYTEKVLTDQKFRNEIAEKESLIADIKKEADPRNQVKKESGVLKSKRRQTADAIRVMSMIDKAIGMNRIDAETRVQAIQQELYDGNITEKTESDFSMTPEKEFNLHAELYALNFAGLENMDNSTLKQKLEELKDIKRQDRVVALKEIEDYKNKISENIKNVVNVVNPNIKQVREVYLPKPSTYRKDSKLRGFSLGHNSFNIILDKLSKFDKESDPFKSWLSKWGMGLTRKMEQSEQTNRRKILGEVQNKLKEIFGNEADMAVFNNTIKQDFEYTDINGKKQSIEISQNEAYKRWMETQDETLATTLEKMGYGTDYINALEQFIKPEVKQWAEWQLKEFYPKYGKELNKTYRDVFGVDMTMNENYSPIYRTQRNVKEDTNLLLSSQNIMNTVNNGSLKSRQGSTLPLAYMDGDRVLINYIYQMEYFKSHAKGLKELNATLFNAEVVNNIEQVHGKEYLTDLRSFMDDFYRKPEKYIMADSIISSFRRNFTVASLALNPVTFIKQLTSIPAYAAFMPAGSWVADQTFWSNPIENGKFLYENSEYLQNRYEAGFDRDEMMAMRSDYKRDLTDGNTFASKMMILTRYGDMSAILVGGWPVYKHYYKQGKAQGMTDQQAKEYGIAQFEEATEQAQQAANIKDLSGFQRGGEVYKVMTMYMTSPIQYHNQAMSALRNIYYGRGSKADNIKKFVIFHMLLPTIFQWTSMGFRFPDEEDEVYDLIRAAVFGNINSVFVVGQFIDYLIKNMIEGKPFDYQTNAVMGGLWSDSKKAGKSITKLIENDNRGIADVADAIDQIARTASNVVAPLAPYKQTSRTIEGIKAVAEGETEFPFRRVIGWSDWALGENPSANRQRNILLESLYGRDYKKKKKEAEKGQTNKIDYSKYKIDYSK